MMKRLVLVLLLLSGFATVVSAQGPPSPFTVIPSESLMLVEWVDGRTTLVQVLTPNLKSGEAFSVLANHDGANTTNYRLSIDGSAVETKPVTALVAGVITFLRPGGLPAGNHTILVEALGPDGVGSMSISIVVDPRLVPGNITNLRIVRGA